MKLKTLLTFLGDEMSGLRAKNAVAEIARFHRIQASPGYDAALRLIAGKLSDAGIQYRVSQFAADGETAASGWLSPPGWTIRSGVLDQVERQPRRLADFSIVQQSILGQSAPGDHEGEIVHVGAGDCKTCFEGRDLLGKFILTHGRPAAMLRFLENKGIAGIILYPDSQRAAASYDLVQYAGLFPEKNQLPWLPMGFSISRRQADDIMKDLEQGTVRVRGCVDAEFIYNPMQVLEAVLPGTDAKAGEILLMAHLCHPAQSANDNASGSGLLIEIACVLANLASRGEQANTVRLVWVPEFNGSVPWAAVNAQRLGHTLFAINLDMVGQSPELIGEPLRVFRIPNSHPVFVNACFEPLLEAIAEDNRFFADQGSRRILHWIVDAPTGGSDHLALQAPPTSIPSAMFGHDDPYWHTNMDTMEKVDASKLEAVGVLTTILSLIPTWALDEAKRLEGWVLSYSQRALIAAAELARTAINGVVTRQLLDEALQIEMARVDSLASLRADWDASHLRHALQITYDTLATDLPRRLPQTQQDDSVGRPNRSMDGPIRSGALDELSPDEQTFMESAFSIHHGAPLQSLANLCDGSRTTAEIAACLSLDFGRLLTREDAERGIAALSDIGYINVQ